MMLGAVEQTLARALYDAGLNDADIGSNVGVDARLVLAWRNAERLPSLNADKRLITPEQAKNAFLGAIEPTDRSLEMGVSGGGTAYIDLDELLTTRLLIQGNSGSGKSHLLRKLLEESAGKVQQVIIDPEGDFAAFGEEYGHMLAAAGEYDGRLRALAAKVRQHRVSIVLNLDGLDLEQQMTATATFLGGLFEAPREQWFPAIVAIDEAHLFAPAGDNGEEREVRKASQQAMADLMCRGRKRGLAGVIATQRLAKLHKNVAAEASNFLMGRTFLDIDIGRATDLLGLPRAQMEQIRDLSRGEFLGLGPAISRRPIKIRIGAVKTSGKAGAPADAGLPPQLSTAELTALMHIPDEEAPKLALRVVK